MRCHMCGGRVDPTKDLFITVHERKGASLDMCSLACATRYLDDED